MKPGPVSTKPKDLCTSPLADLAGGLDVSNLSQRVFHHIRGLIVTGTLRGGQRIPEHIIARSLGVSRTPIREALRRLEEHGLVVFERRHAACVATITREDRRRIGEVRLQLSLLSARLLARRATPADGAALKDIAARCQASAERGDRGACFDLDSLLHCQIAERSGNPYLAELTRTLDHKVQLLRNIEEVSQQQLLRGISLHGPLVEALCRGDVSAAENLMSDHITQYYFMAEEGKT
jgi:DNA-binding GntR family transcriptional regulator